MFTKSADPTVPPRPAAGSASKSVLASDLRINGDVTSTGQIEMMGDVDGTLTARGLVIGAEGKMTGSVTADIVEVRGALSGDVTTQSLTLRAAAIVAADVVYTALVIESGAQIEGKFKRLKDANPV